MANRHIKLNEEPNYTNSSNLSVQKDRDAESQSEQEAGDEPIDMSTVSNTKPNQIYSSGKLNFAKATLKGPIMATTGS